MNFQNVVILALGAAVVAVFSTLAPAQQMYRCGNNYQDTPCEPGRETKRLGSTTRAVGVATTPVAVAGADAQCASWGEASTKIVWAREAGMTMDRQLSEANSDQQRRLIASVYQKRGAAPAIRLQIEAECKEEQDKRKQLQALAEAAGQVKSSLPPDPAPANASVSQTQSSGSDGGARIAAASSAASHKATCDRLNATMQTLREDQRGGGSTVTMERLNQQKRNLEAVLRTNACS